MTTPAVLVHHLTKTYRDRTAVADLHLEVPAGSTTVLVGPNGSGKTTTLEMVATLRRPTSGTIEVFGHDTVRAPHEVRRRIGVALQASALDPLMTPAETLRLQGRAWGLSPAASRARARAEVLELLDLGAWRDTRIATLSGGTRRRVDLAVALVGEPLCLLLDEPTTGIDPVNRLGLWDELRRLQRTLGTTVLLSTQDLHEAEALATTMVMLRSGSVLHTGTPTDFRRLVGTRTLSVTSTSDEGVLRLAKAVSGLASHTTAEAGQVRVPLRPDDTSAEQPWAPLLAAVAGHADDVAALHLDQPSLDDAFLALALSPEEVSR